jgi:hypothetical protein
MKKIKLMFLIGLSTLFMSCTSYRVVPVGELTMASTRNIDDSKEYVALRNYAGISRTDVEASISSSKKGIIKRRNPIIKEINSYKSSRLQDAIDNVVKSVPGGEYLRNVRLYAVTESSMKSSSKVFTMDYVVTGDVWGIEDGDHDIKGFLVDDKVVFTYNKDLRKLLKRNFKGKLNKQYTGKILGLKGGFGTIQLDNGTVLDIPYSNLTKIN